MKLEAQPGRHGPARDARAWPRALAFLALSFAVALFSWSCGDDTSSPEVTEGCGDEPGVICTWAGTGEPGFDGDGHTLLESKFYWPIDMTITPSGGVYILDWNNHRVRALQSDGTLQTIIGTDFVGDGPDDLSDLVPPGAPGTTVHLNHPTHLIELPNGKLLLTAWHNHKLRTYDPATGLVLVMCGRGAGFAGDGSLVDEETRLNQPQQTILGPDGSLFFLDQRNERVRKIDADGIITTVVGTGVAGFSGDGGPPLEAQINLPAGSNPPAAGAIVFDDQWRLYISDAKNNRIRRVDFDLDVIETFAGNGDAVFSGDGGPSTEASFNNPRDMVFGPDGNLFIADEWNHRVRCIDMDTGIITTVAGNGEQGYSGDGGQAVEASLNRPSGLEFDFEGHLYIVDYNNHLIRRVNL